MDAAGPEILLRVSDLVAAFDTDDGQLTAVDGVTFEVNKGKTEKNILIDFINKKLPYIRGAQGCLTAQFFKHKTTDRILGIEINPKAVIAKL